MNGRNGTALIKDTDAGQYDGDSRYDRAVGPMQFIPSTWAIVGVDADNDGRRDPQDIYDASLASAVYLCSGQGDLATEAGQLVMAQQLVDELAAAMAPFADGMDAARARLSAVSAVLATRQAQDGAEEPLTARELEVLRLLGGPLSLSEIADALYVSSNTVKTHTQAVYRKLGVHSRERAIAVARRERLL